MIQIDKIAHFLAGFFIATVVNIIPLRCDHPDLIYMGFFVAVFAGLFKELVIDLWMNKSVFDPADFLAACIGGSLGLFVDFLKL
jgi:hypothetical protein